MGLVVGKSRGRPFPCGAFNRAPYPKSRGRPFPCGAFNRAPYPLSRKISI